MANGCRKNCITWRGIGLIIGWAAVIPMLPTFTFIFLLSSIFNDYGFDGVTGVITISMIANVMWIYGLTDYKPRCMLFSLIWCAFLAGLYFQDLKRETDQNEKMYVTLSALIIYILALFSYDSISNHVSRARANQSRIGQFSTNLTQVNQSRLNGTPTAPNEPLHLTCEVPIITTDDTKSLIMMVD